MADPAKRDPRIERPANKRGAARLAAVQALYQMEVGRVSLEETLAQFCSHRLGQELEGDQYLPADEDWFRQIVSGVLRHQRRIDPLVDAALAKGWPVTRIDATLRAILRCGTFELIEKADIPHRVVISEYVDVAKAFFEGEAPGLVNGVLDRIAAETRE